MISLNASQSIQKQKLAKAAFGRLSHPLPVSFLTGLLAFILFLLTVAPDLTWAHFGADGGELIAAAVTLGIPHPPGYPTYVLLGKLFSYLPLGTIAYRLHLLSALSIAIATGFVTAVNHQTISNSHHSLITTLSASLAFAFAPLVWSQALIAEVYALNLAFLSIFLWALMGKRPSLFVGIFLGLSVTTHLTSLLMLPLAITLTPYTSWHKLASGFLLGLLPLAMLPLLAAGTSPIIWGDPTTTSGWWWLVSGQLYHANVSLTAHSDLKRQLAAFGYMLAQQVAWLGFLPLIIGLYQTTKRARQKANVVVLMTVVAYGLLALSYTTPDAKLYFLPGLLLLSPFLATGLHKFKGYALLLPLALMLLNFNTLSLNQVQPPRAAAEIVFQKAPEDAILLTSGDRSIFSLWYFQIAEGQRPDLILVDSNLLAFPWYRARLQQQQPTLTALEEDDVGQFLSENSAKRPLCTVSLLNQQKINCTKDSP